MEYVRKNGDVRYEKNNGDPPFSFKFPPMYKWREPKTTIPCACCGTLRNPDSFLLAPDSTWGNMDAEGRPRTLYCLGCLEEIYKYFVTQDPNKNKYKALYRVCMMINYYYNDEIAHKVIEEKGFYENGTPVSDLMGVVDRYTRVIMNHQEYKTKVFWDSDNLVWTDVLKYQRSTGVLSLEARENRNKILAVFHNDPFENESREDKELMYNDLVTMMDDAMNEDLVRQKSAIEIVRAFNRIDKLSEAIRVLQTSPDSIIENDRSLKTLIEQKSKETTLVTNFSKDHGFAEKYAMSKSKGSGTLSAVIRDMKDFHYDKGVVNRYDIETSEAIRKISDISAESIFKQIELQESEYADMVKEQAEELVKIRQERDKLKEELRLLKEKHLKEELLEELKNELKEKHISDADIDSILKSEINIE